MGNRVEGIDGLRALAALYVVGCHAILMVWGLYNGMVPPTLLLPFIHGHFAVTIFIVVSGFCLMLPVIRRDLTLRGGFREFITRRVLRILPVLYIALIFSSVVVWCYMDSPRILSWDSVAPVTVKSFLANIFMVQDIFALWKINGALWSMAVEWRLYFFFPLIILGWRRFGPVPTTVVALIIGVATELYIYAHLPDLYFMTWQYLGLFAIGMLAAGIATSDDPLLTHLRENISWHWLALAGLGALLIISLVTPWQFLYYYWILHDIWIGLTGACLLIAAATGKFAPIRNVLSWRPLVFIGGFSYSLYLVHPPLLNIMWHVAVAPFILSPLAQVTVMTLVGLPVAIFCAWLFYLAVERPFLRIIAKRGKAPIIVPIPPTLVPEPAPVLVAEPD